MIMKIPLPPTSNGFYNGAEYGYGGDHPHDDMDSPTLDGDFSEYMWMENEEEFDKQVMQQLEEEALMEQCIEIMLEDEREAALLALAPWSNGVECGIFRSTNELCEEMNALRVAPEAVAANSTLNPLAVEFVPSYATENTTTTTTTPVVAANS